MSRQDTDVYFNSRLEYNRFNKMLSTLAENIQIAASLRI